MIGNQSVGVPGCPPPNPILENRRQGLEQQDTRDNPENVYLKCDNNGFGTQCTVLLKKLQY